MERPTFYSSMIQGTGYAKLVTSFSILWEFNVFWMKKLGTDGTSSFVHELSRVFEIPPDEADFFHLIDHDFRFYQSQSHKLSKAEGHHLEKTMGNASFRRIFLKHIHEISNPQVPLLGSRDSTFCNACFLFAPGKSSISSETVAR